MSDSDDTRKVVSMTDPANPYDASTSSKRYHGGGGDGTMDEYATKKDLQLSETKTNAKIDRVSDKMDSLSDKLPLLIKDAVRSENDRLASERKQERHYIMATWVIGGLTLLVAIVSAVISLMH